MGGTADDGAAPAPVILRADPSTLSTTADTTTPGPGRDPGRDLGASGRSVYSQAILPRRSRTRTPSRTVQGTDRHRRPWGATACLLVGSLVVAGCASTADGDGELTVGVIDGFVQPAGSVNCVEFHQHAATLGREESPHARRTLETMRPGLEAVCSARDGAVTVHHHGIAISDTLEAEAFDAALRVLESRGTDLLILPLTFDVPTDSAADTIARMHRSGTVVLAAAGNRPGLSSGFPASMPETISVGAADQHGDPRWYSPVTGVDVLVHVPDGEPGEGGTSSATAQAARILLERVSRGSDTTGAAHQLQTSHPYERTP